MDDVYKEPEAYYNVTPKDWVNVMSNIICERCMDELRSIFMKEKQPKRSEGILNLEERVSSQGRKEEHWLTRNGTRVVVKMPLPAVGHFASEPESISDERHLVRWNENFNCVEVSWLQSPSGAMLALYDLAQRLDDSVEKEQA